jgi:hypothetical protein
VYSWKREEENVRIGMYSAEMIIRIYSEPLPYMVVLLIPLTSGGDGYRG